MSYCQEIKDVISHSESILISAEKYEGPDREAKYQFVAIANHFSKKKINLASFNKNRCKPSFTEQQISAITESTNQMIVALQNLQSSHDSNASTDDTIIVDDNDAVAFLSGNPMAGIKDQYYRLHQGDDDAISTVIWGFCIKWMTVANDEGIHIIAVGLRGSGKSHGIMSGMKFLPPELTWIIGISARFLYYTDELKRGFTIYLDELPSDPNLLDSIKAIITSYPMGGKRGTVLEGKPVWQYVPARVTINTSSVDQKSDEQFTNRMTVIRSAVEKEKIKQILDFRLQLYGGDVCNIDPEKVNRIHNALRYITRKNFTVIIPIGAIEISDYSKTDTRVFNQFMAAMQGNAILNYPKRPHQENGNDIRVYVTKDDFDAVIHLYQKPDEYNLKLTPATYAVKNYLEKNYPNHKTLGEIEIATSLAPNTIKTSLKGRKDRHVECLIDAGYVEEIGITSQEKEIVTKGSGAEYSKYIGERIVTKAFRATNPEPSVLIKSKSTEAGNSNLDKFAVMVTWNQEKADLVISHDENNTNTTNTTKHQALVLTNTQNNTTINTTNNTILTPLTPYIEGGV